MPDEQAFWAGVCEEMARQVDTDLVRREEEERRLYVQRGVAVPVRCMLFKRLLRRAAADLRRWARRIGPDAGASAWHAMHDAVMNHCRRGSYVVCEVASLIDTGEAR